MSTEDIAWLRAAAGGEAPAVRRLLDEVGPVVYGYAYARVGGDEAAAADIVQDTFLEAMRSAASFRGESALSTWICAIARRRLARHFEAERRQVEARRRLELVPQLDVDTIDMVDELDERDRVVRALGRLSPDQRHVLVMKYLDGDAVADIAAQLGRTRIQVQSLLQRARNALRVELGEAT